MMLGFPACSLRNRSTSSAALPGMSMPVALSGTVSSPVCTSWNPPVLPVSTGFAWEPVGPQRSSPVDDHGSPFSVRPQLASLAARSQSPPALRHREDLSDDDGAGTWRDDAAAPTLSRSHDLLLEAHVERLNAMQHTYAVTGPPTNYRRTLPYRKNEYASRAHIGWHVLPTERPPDAPKLPGPRYSMAKVDHYKLGRQFAARCSPAAVSGAITVARRSTPCTDSQYPSSMAFHLTFIMAIGLPAAERLDHLNGTFHAWCTIDSDALPVPGL